MFRIPARIAFAIILMVIVYATVVPISLRPNSGHLHSERVLAYLALGGTMALAFPRRLHWTVAAVIAIACGLEFLQTFIPSRDGRLPDAIEKSLGGLVGVAGGWATDALSTRLSLKANASI